mmetsp:Transcript_42484/g.68308  ORF Transcript_42484/g.68308 Transcript_42484/m.68308 type:complete len:237 (+) Transcript_42484:27-737(+)
MALFYVWVSMLLYVCRHCLIKCAVIEGVVSVRGPCVLIGRFPPRRTTRLTGEPMVTNTSVLHPRARFAKSKKDAECFVPVVLFPGSQPRVRRRRATVPRRTHARIRRARLLRGGGGDGGRLGGRFDLVLLVLEVEGVCGGDEDSGEAHDVLPVERLGEQNEGDDDGEHLAQRLDDLRLGGAVVLDERQDEGHRGVPQDGESHDHGDDLGVGHGEGPGWRKAAGGKERDEAVEGPDE